MNSLAELDWTRARAAASRPAEKREKVWGLLKGRWTAKKIRAIPGRGAKVSEKRSRTARPERYRGGEQREKNTCKRDGGRPEKPSA